MDVNDYKILPLTSCEDIVDIISAMPDVKSNLSKRVDISVYSTKLSLYADNFVLVDKEKTKGFVSLYANDEKSKTAFITLIACLSDERGKGYGAVLFEYACRHAKACGMEELRLEVDRDNDRGISFYQKHGMNIISNTEYGHIMSKKL